VEERFSYRRYLISNFLITSLFFSLITAAEAGENQPSTRAVTVSVDPRVELISIIFRLAGNQEYHKGKVLRYTADVEKQFGPFKDHPVIEFAMSLREKRGVSFDAPMSLAVHINDVNSMEMRVPLESRPVGLDTRWRPEDVRDFLEKAEQFANVSDFDGFIKNHQPLYDRSSQRMRSLLEDEAHLEWFDDFFGARPDTNFHVFLAMLNGPSNYGAKVKLAETEEYYCILGVWSAGLLGFGEPKFNKNMLPIVIHEFCHSYANQIVDAHMSELEEPGKKIFAKVSKKMERMAYGNWQTMMRESLVRVCVVRYLAKNEDQDAAGKQIESEIRNGFFWMQELSDVLIQYEQQRDKYPKLDAFFPEVVDFYNNYEID